MTRLVVSEFRCWPALRVVRLLLGGVTVAAGWSGGVLPAQDAPTPRDVPIPTLHAYTNTIQIPVLVLDADRERILKPIKANQFSVSIDSGPWFRASHVRQEGDDPISLSILLDVRGGAGLMPRIDAAIAGLAPLGLHPKDHVSIYALDCSLVRSLNDAPAESGRLKLAVNQALEWRTIRTKKRHESNCQQSIHLWDALAYLTRELDKLPGRRVILAVTDGHDSGSRNTWKEVTTYADVTGVAVFGVTYSPAEVAGGIWYLRWSSEDPFHSVCELSGGMVLLTAAISLDVTLQRFVTMLRERYIVEFPRPANSTSGKHTMNVQIANGNYFVRPAGISVPIPDPALLADPTTVPSDPSRTPVQGTRKPLAH
jgi:hypothetical protein